MKKIYVYGILVLVLIVLPAIFFNDGEEIVDSMSDLSYISNIKPQAKFNSIEVKVSSSDKDCFKIVEEVVNRFENVKIIEKLKGDNEIVLNDKTLVGGVGCSEKILTYNICEMLISPPGFCNYYGLEELEDNTVFVDENKECYKPCLLEYYTGNNIEQTYWRSPPCLHVDNYLYGITKSKEKVCYGGSCLDEEEKGCCADVQCVDNGVCYDENSLIDTDNDGSKEVCLEIEEEYVWVDPDMGEQYCDYIDKQWVDCSIFEQCRYGEDTYSSKDDGLCCGDEKEEEYIECEGVGCFADDGSCCPENSCAYLGKCYDKGCYELNTEEGYVARYCDGEKWLELDNSKSYCELCNKEWAGRKCCGDDEGEGKDAFRVILKNNYGQFGTMFSECSSSLFSCLSMEERCQDFNFNDTIGKYYCSFGKWIDNDMDKSFCEECGGKWLEECCGDDEGEFLVEGIDGTMACCDSELSYVKEGECMYTQLCGNNILEETEECELPNTNNSLNCNQERTICENGKSGIRDGFGSCGECLCEYDDFSFQCIKDKCGSGCGDDDDCGLGQKCSKKDCQCHNIASQELLPECPHSIHITVNNHTFVPGDEFKFTISIFDENNELMKEMEFIMDLIVDEEVVGEGIYSTGGDGIFKLKREVTNGTYPGKFVYIAKTVYGFCPVLSDKIEVEFEVPITRKQKEKIKSKASKEIAQDYELVYYEQSVGECGNSILEIGEMCEMDNLCKAGKGCNYDLRIYDSPGYCSSCECLESDIVYPDNQEYCDSCNSCGDGKLNCGEMCEVEKEYLGDVCVDDKIKEEYNVCSDCNGYEIGYSDFIKDNCECGCESYVEENCVGGDYVQYPEKYLAGCSETGCNECLCEDVYTKDSNNDGIEDKCSPEICDNNFDDNDDGIVDEKDCEPFYCDSCNSIINFCTEQKCSVLKEGCYFEETFVNIGFCSSCFGLAYCEEYYYEEDNCRNNPCGLSNCFWEEGGCCTDSDGDSVCDYRDNCYGVSNPNQEDFDNDGYGNECDYCWYEEKLQYPLNEVEIVCDDGIDEDCDNFLDCMDLDCYEVCNETIS